MSIPDFKIAYGQKWKKIFYHDLSKSTLFTSYDEALKSFDKDKYSCLYTLDNKRYKINGVYEFLLEYPGYTGYNRWTQTKNPLETKHTDSAKEVGYTPVTITWRDLFGGLQIHNLYGCSAFDCNQDTSNNWFTIATYRNYEREGYFPGFYKQIVQKAVLYIKITNNFSCDNAKIIIKLYTIYTILFILK